MAEHRAAFAERALALSGLASLAFPLFYLATTLHFVPTTATTIKNLQYVEYEAVKTAVRAAQFWPALACTLFMLPACLMGAALPRLQHRFQKILSVQIFAKALPLLFCGAAGVLVLFMTYHKEFYWFCSIPGAIFCGVFGWRNVEKSCEKIFTPWVLLFSAGETVVVLLIFRMIQTEYSPTGLAWVFFAQAAICALSQNQSNLSARIKWKNFEQLPAKIRWYNFFLTLGILAAILLLMLFRDGLAAVGEQLLDGSPAAYSVAYWFSRRTCWEQQRHRTESSSSAVRLGKFAAPFRCQQKPLAGQTGLSDSGGSAYLVPAGDSGEAQRAEEACWTAFFSFSSLSVCCKERCRLQRLDGASFSGAADTGRNSGFSPSKLEKAGKGAHPAPAGCSQLS